MDFKVNKYDLCDSCRKIRQRMSDGSLGPSIEECIDSEGYRMSVDGNYMMNRQLEFYLENNDGCSECIAVVKDCIDRAERWADS